MNASVYIKTVNVYICSLSHVVRSGGSEKSNLSHTVWLSDVWMYAENYTERKWKETICLCNQYISCCHSFPSCFISKSNFIERMLCEKWEVNSRSPLNTNDNQRNPYASFMCHFNAGRSAEAFRVWKQWLDKIYKHTSSSDTETGAVWTLRSVYI